MRDLELLLGPVDLPNLTVYRYRTRALRLAVLNRLRQAVALRGFSLVRSGTEDFVARMSGTAFFASDSEALYLDWTVWRDRAQRPERLSPEDELDEKVVQVSLHSFLTVAQGRDEHATPVVIFVDATDDSLESWRASPSDLVIDATTSVSLDEVPKLVTAIAGSASLDASRHAEIVSQTRRLLRGRTPFAVLCDEIETMVHTPALGGGVATTERAVGRNQRYSTSQLRALLLGMDGARDAFMRHFLRRPHREMELLEELVGLTTRLLQKHRSPNLSGDPADLFAAHSALLWFAVVLRHWRALWQVGGNKGRIWPSPDRSARALLLLLDDAARVMTERRIDSGGWENAVSAVHLSGLTSSAIGVRLTAALREMVGSFAANIDPVPTQVVELAQRLLSLTQQRPDLKSPAIESGDQPAQLRSLDDLVGRQAAKFAFLQRLDLRHSDPRAFRRPLLLAGPDGVGKRVVADLFARLFVCDVASSDDPRVCGKCDGCKSFGLRALNTDVSQLIVSFDKTALGAQIRNRGTVAGTSAHVVHGLENLPREQAQSILKSIEEEVGAGLRIFTTRNLECVSDALRSRCHTVHVWPLRKAEAIRFATNLLSLEHGALLDGRELEIVLSAAGNVGEIVDRLQPFVR